MLLKGFLGGKGITGFRLGLGFRVGFRGLGFRGFRGFRGFSGFVRRAPKP